MTGTYLELFHGRKDPKEQMQDWGEQGPIFGPLQYAHTTYAHELKIEFKDGATGVISISYDEDLLYYDGMYYGDWSVFHAEIAPDDQWRLQPYSQEKADIPTEVTSGS